MSANECVRFAVNVALLRPAIQSSTYSFHKASLAVDNNMTTYSCTLSYTAQPWWSVDLGKPMDVGRVCVTNDKNLFYGQLQLCHLVTYRMGQKPGPHCIFSNIENYHRYMIFCTLQGHCILKMSLMASLLVLLHKVTPPSESLDNAILKLKHNII